MHEEKGQDGINNETEIRVSLEYKLNFFFYNLFNIKQKFKLLLKKIIQNKFNYTLASERAEIVN